ncbi:MAG: D-alanyl-D-alanine carboxypeptidase family protein, partial [Prevotella copri]|nr:D-alanyl-D-alanine carboxypeptidase family protein [Segatella copri]
MILDAKKEGIVLWISSGYRDVNYQTKLFNRQIERENSKAVISP